MERMKIVPSHASLRVPPQFDALAYDPLHHLILHVTYAVSFWRDLVGGGRVGLHRRRLASRSIVVVYEDLSRVRADHRRRQQRQKQARECHWSSGLKVHLHEQSLYTGCSILWTVIFLGKQIVIRWSRVEQTGLRARRHVGFGKISDCNKVVP